MRRTLMLGVLAALSACSSLERSPQDAAHVRASERWQLLLDGRFDEAYGYHTPRIRESQTLERFRQQFGAQMAIKSAKVVKVECDNPKSCLVRVRVETGAAFPGFVGKTLETHIDERWVKVGAEWQSDMPS
jgi:hypothetical protein